MDSTIAWMLGCLTFGFTCNAIATLLIIRYLERKNG